MIQPFDLHISIQTLLPFKKRKPRFIAWVKVFTSHLKQIAADQFLYWNTTDRDAKMTPQVCYIEKFLNDRYATTDIKIVEGRELGPWCFYDGPPNGEVDMFMVEPDNYCYSDAVVTSVSFVVEVPVSLEEERYMIAAIVQKYKLPGKSFMIQLV